MGEEARKNPKWSSSAKILAGVVMLAAAGYFLTRFMNILIPLLLAFIITYLLRPYIALITKRTRLSWNASVSLIFLLFIVLVTAAMSLLGVVLVQETQRIGVVVIQFIEDAPSLIEEWVQNEYVIGLWTIKPIDFFSEYQLDLGAVSSQIISTLRPLLDSAGGVIGSAATSVISVVSWSIFVVLISFFMLTTSGKGSSLISWNEIPEYKHELSRLGRELDRIWNAYLRGQIFLVGMITAATYFGLALLGVSNALALAILTGLTRFIPYIGSIISWAVAFIVALFMSSNIFGVDPLWFAVIVLVLNIIIGAIFDNLVSPRIFGDALGVHPAAVLIAAMVAANMFGIIGLLVAAPLLASVQLFGSYILRKMLDINPFPQEEAGFYDFDIPFEDSLRKIWRKIKPRKAKQK